MKIIVFGATGRVGNQILRHALDDTEEHMVTAFVRDPSKLEIEDERLEVVTGDVLDANQVRRTVKGHDVVFSALGAPLKQSSYRVLSIGLRNIANSMEKYGIKRLVSIGAAGILQDREEPENLRIETDRVPEFLKGISEEHKKIYEKLKETELDWTIVCPPNMPNGEETGDYRTSMEHLPENGKEISVEDVAAFAYSLKNDEEYFRKRVGIAY